MLCLSDDQVMQIHMCTYCRYLGSGESNMAIVDVEIPSGYVFDKLYDPSKVVQRHEVRGSNAVFYINEVRK